MEICMSVCVDAEYGYSKNNTMPWSIQSEYVNFLKLLSSYPKGNSSILIGRVTWETDQGVPADLIDHFAKILVISRTKMINEHNEKIISFDNITKAIHSLKEYLLVTNNKYPHRLYILGGGDIYRECFELDLIDELIISKLPKSYQCTQFLSWLPKEIFKKMQLKNTIFDFEDEFIIEKYNKLSNFNLTCESVTEGHPDKVCDIISDAVVDAYIQEDKWSKVACEVMAYENMVWLCGYSLSHTVVDEEKIVRQVLQELGLDDESKGLDYKTCNVSVNIHKSPSPNLNDLSKIPADDQAVLYGYATNELMNDSKNSMMPCPYHYATKLTLRLSYLRRCAASQNHHDLSDDEVKLSKMLRPAGKAQVTAEYNCIDKFTRKILINVIVLEAQHNPNVDLEELKLLLRQQVIDKMIPPEFLAPTIQYFINGDGEYTHGGFRGGGLTGRKQNIDNYGGVCRSGGGAFSGKDYRKMDRSGAYAARWIAKSLVAADLCDRCTVGIAYAIGYAKPLMITIDTECTASLRGYSDKQLVAIVEKNFDLTVGGIVTSLDLQTPVYKRTAAGGHFGRDGFSWEIPLDLEI